MDTGFEPDLIYAILAVLIKYQHTNTMIRGHEVLAPRDISSTYVDHIYHEGNHTKGLDRPLFTGGEATLWCVDRKHTNWMGRKPGVMGWVVAGAGVRLTDEFNDINLLKPYEFLQAAAGEYPEGVTVVFRAHENCGLIFSHGYVTEQQQRSVVIDAQAIWATAMSDLRRNSPGDAKRIILKEQIGKKGTAPVVRFTQSGRVEIANKTYLDEVIRKYPLAEAVIDRLEPKQREDLEGRGLIYHRG